jgi:cellulose synthase (UDP-forming)
VPVLARRRLLALRCLGVAAVVLGAVYVGWRVTATVGPDGLGFAFWAAELVAYVSLAFTVVTMWNRRSRDGPARPPRGTLDVFVPVCGEPVEMVRETLRAAAAIAYPHRLWLLNDGRIAGKDNWLEIDELARELNVRRLTRTGGRRGKAGNLNHALQASNAEFVGVIDADHRVDPDFAHETLGYFEGR